jgi:hypothetical protein
LKVIDPKSAPYCFNYLPTETGFAKFVTFIAYKYFPLTGEDGSINLLICPESIDLYVDSL